MQTTHRKSDRRRLILRLSGLLAATGCAGQAGANGIDRNGHGARSMALGGASGADADDALAATGLNPALLGFLGAREFKLGAAAAFAEGDYRSQNGGSGSLENTWGVMPEAAMVLPAGEKAVLGISIIPDSTRLANWHYSDPVGAAGASYNERTHRSEILNLRGAVSLGLELTEELSIGAGAGLVYTRNGLDSPYIFQSHPALKGAKTLLDLETEGWGINFDAGLAWKVTEDVTFGLSYRSPTKFETEGTANGDVTRQLKALGLRGVDGRFGYDADIDTELPQKVAAALAVEASETLRFYGQAEWVNWSSAYDDLKVRLSRGSNKAINGVLGSDDLTDVIPLEWKDRVVLRLGAEWDVTENIALRAGYAWGRSPVPDETLLPMTAAISEHTLSAGIGWHRGPWSVDLAWQYDLPASQNAGSDTIAGTEYDGSRVELSSHWLGLTAGFAF